MNKREFVSAIADKTGFAKKDIVLVVNAIYEVVEEALANDDEILLAGFGKFFMKRFGASVMNDITKPGRRIELPKRMSPRFKFSKNLNDALKRTIDEE